MRTILAFIVAAWMAVWPCYANPWLSVVGKPPPSGGGGGPTSDNFSGAGTPTGWSTVSGSPNFDDTSGPFSSSDHLSCAGASGSEARRDFGSALSEVYFAFRVRFDVEGGANPLILAGSGDGMTTQSYSASELAFSHGATGIYSWERPTYTPGSDYVVFGHYVAESGGGGNGVLAIYWGTSTTRAGSPTFTITAGTGDAVRYFHVYGGYPYTHTIHVDDFSFSTTDFSTLP